MGQNRSRKKVLLHICCGPDATVAFERLRGEFDSVPVFYNPNIHPEEEYLKRLRETVKVCDLMGVPLKTAEYETEEWFGRVQGFEKEPEGGKRCAICYELRLEKTALMAKEQGFDFFSTVLTVSPHKDSRLLFEIGEKIGRKVGVPFLPENFKKKDGFRRSVELSREMALYRQDYCGCIFSLKEKELLQNHARS